MTWNCGLVCGCGCLLARKNLEGTREQVTDNSGKNKVTQPKETFLGVGYPFLKRLRRREIESIFCYVTNSIYYAPLTLDDDDDDDDEGDNDYGDRVQSSVLPEPIVALQPLIAGRRVSPYRQLTVDTSLIVTSSHPSALQSFSKFLLDLPYLYPFNCKFIFNSLS
ncbi:unnamed protein product [Allacma fusca]|uniref:Uncharacterized protein n=1 Tax=Allacma fusca TaxID=39272 RepID=A0A8J2JKC2_9HEXA|nr:unnamed protein product [Allacma fusca]